MGLEQLLGKRVRINDTEIAGVVTDVREVVIMDMEFANGAVEQLPAYVEIDGNEF